MDRSGFARIRSYWPQFAIVVVIALLSAASLLVFFSTGADLRTLLDFLGARLFIVLVYGAIGYLITTRRPDLAVGWLVLGGAVLLAASALSLELGYRSRQPGVTVPGGALAVWPGFWIGPAGIGMLVLALAVFPNGPLRTRGGRIALWSQIGIALTYVTNLAVVPHRSLVTGLPNPIAISALAPVPFYRLNVLLGLAGLVVVLASLMVRYRGATTMAQQQIRWVIPFVTLYAVLTAAQLVLLQLYVITDGTIDLASSTAAIGAVMEFVLVTVLLPLAIGIGIVRYRWFDIDLVINRALVYGGVSAILAGAFAGLSTAVQYVLRTMTGQQSELVSVVLAVLAAIVFAPLKSRVQAIVDRRLREDPHAPVGSRPTAVP